jgi:hypothetical protein
MTREAIVRIAFAWLLLASVAVLADETAASPPAGEEKAAASAKQPPPGPKKDVEMSGMSILGNDEAPKSLVIVPWKGSQLGDMPGLSKLLDDSTQPVDKDVFLRELGYYRIRTHSK